ncbi:MAG: LPS export ABC transporter periplasmic protein LptC [Bacteroidota bacterium]
MYKFKNIIPKIPFPKALVGSLLILAVFSCENDLAEVSKFIDDDEVAIEVGETVKMLYSDSGRVEMMIEAPVLHRHLDKRTPKREFPKGLEVFFLDEEQKVQSWLTGKYAIEDENMHIITVQDSVVLFNNNAETLETDELIWDQSSNKIHTKQFVRITTKDEQITGYGFEADREFKYWKIIAPQGKVKVNPDKLDN